MTNNNTPKYYLYNGKDVLEIAKYVYGEEAVKNFLEISAFKYRLRAGKKTKEFDKDMLKALNCEDVIKKEGNIIKYTVFILCTETNEVRKVNMDFNIGELSENDPYYDPHKHILYMWKEGNYSCDCNRHDFFHKDNETEPEIECSNHLYKVNLFKDGVYIYKEF